MNCLCIFLVICSITEITQQESAVKVKSFGPSNWIKARELCLSSMTYINLTSDIDREIPVNFRRNHTQIFIGNVEITTGALKLEGCYRLTGFYKHLMDYRFSESIPETSGEVAYCALLCSNSSSRFALQENKCKCLFPDDVPRIEDVSIRDNSQCSECLNGDGFCGNGYSVTIYRSVPSLNMTEEGNLCYDGFNQSIPCFGWFPSKSGVCEDGHVSTSLSWMSLNTLCTQDYNSYLSNDGDVLNTRHYRTYVMESDLPTDFNDQYRTDQIPVFGKFGYIFCSNVSARYEVAYENDDKLLEHSVCTMSVLQNQEENNDLTVYVVLGAVGACIMFIICVAYIYFKPKRVCIKTSKSKTSSVYGTIPPQA